MSQLLIYPLPFFRSSQPRAEDYPDARLRRNECLVFVHRSDMEEVSEEVGKD
jgi:hypothetical protein